MARLARSVLLGYPHAVSQRGNREQTVFEENADYRRYPAGSGNAPSATASTSGLIA